MIRSFDCLVRRFNRPARLLGITLCAALLAPPPAVQAQSDGALPAKLSREARVAIQNIVDSAHTAGLPTSQLVDKVAEGVLKGADDQRIIFAVRTLAHELGDARTVVGANASPTLLAASASALHAGVTQNELRDLVRPSSSAQRTDASLATALVTLVDLIAKRIAPHEAADAVSELLQHRAPDDQFTALRTEVDRDVQAGVAPTAALKSRMRTRLQSLDGAGRGSEVPIPMPKQTGGAQIPES